jgi:hypothetical protein
VSWFLCEEEGNERESESERVCLFVCLGGKHRYRGERFDFGFGGSISAQDLKRKRENSSLLVTELYVDRGCL